MKRAIILSELVLVLVISGCSIQETDSRLLEEKPDKQTDNSFLSDFTSFSDLFSNYPSYGNKRVAITALIVFLLKNHRWLAMDTDLLYRFTVWIAQSRPDDMDFVLAATERLLESHLMEA